MTARPRPSYHRQGPEPMDLQTKPSSATAPVTDPAARQPDPLGIVRPPARCEARPPWLAVLSAEALPGVETSRRAGAGQRIAGTARCLAQAWVLPRKSPALCRHRPPVRAPTECVGAVPDIRAGSGNPTCTAMLDLGARCAHEPGTVRSPLAEVVRCRRSRREGAAW